MLAVARALLPLLPILPLALLLCDLVPFWRARRMPLLTAEGLDPIDDFAVLVPIYGDISYLENVEYLRQYGSRVVLCTTAYESSSFNYMLDYVARRHGFRVFRARASGVRAHARRRRRRVSGAIRDRLVRDALEIVDAPYVVCIDADTVTAQPLGHLVSALAHHGLDVASVRLVPSNTSTFLGRLQAHEYRMAMRLRPAVPFVVSGACHVARTHVHREVMRRHSLFFQGNDVEVGLLADALGYRVGHIAFDVPTRVPGTFGSWWRQRLAWAGGEFRLFVVNMRIGRRHPFFYFYGAVLMIALWPWRCLCLVHPNWLVYAVLLAYLVAVLAKNWPDRDRALLVMPLYSLFTSVVLCAFGPLWYVRMAIADRNWGLIRPTVAASPAIAVT